MYGYFFRSQPHGILRRVLVDLTHKSPLFFPEREPYRLCMAALHGQGVFHPCPLGLLQGALPQERVGNLARTYLPLPTTRQMNRYLGFIPDVRVYIAVVGLEDSGWMVGVGVHPEKSSTSGIVLWMHMRGPSPEATANTRSSAWERLLREDPWSSM
jgi:hypothetical protein